MILAEAAESSKGVVSLRCQLKVLVGVGLASLGIHAGVPAVASASHHRSSILVKVKAGTNIRALAKRNGLVVRRYLRPIHWVELGPRGHGALASATPRLLGRRVASDPAVREVDAGETGDELEWDIVPVDPVFNPQLKVSGGLIKLNEGEPEVGWHFFRPNFPTAWNHTQGHGVTVAVIDSEFDTSNLDLGEKLVGRYNVASGTPQYHSENVAFQKGDAYHGSHTAGLVGAKTNNGIGVAGACYECGILAIKIGSESSGTFVNAGVLADVAEGLLYAANRGARVISMSLGSQQQHAPLADAVSYAAGKDAVIVASAGNTQLTPQTGVPHYPAAYPRVIGVGATDSNDQIANFSSQGPWVDVAAPGKTVLSTTNAGDPAAMTFAEDPAPKPRVAFKSGTSMAAPLVAGLAALMRAARPDLNAAEVESLIEATARDLGIAGRDVVYGAGRIEAGAAIAAALAYTRPAAAQAPPAAAPPQMQAKKIGARVLLKVRRRGGKLIYTGKVVTRPRCRPKRTVFLRAKRAFRPFARRRTSRRGFFRFTLQRRRAPRVRAVVTARKLGSTVVCKGGGSRFIGPRRSGRNR